MAPVTVDPDVYYDTSKWLAGLADRVNTATGTLVTALRGCGGMGGDYDDVKPWATAYDQRADAVIESARSLDAAMRHFGYLLGCAGHNHDLANYYANISLGKGTPPQAPPPEQPAPPLCYVESPPSMGGGGSGLSTDIPGLLAKIGVPVPDGDTDKLAAAEAAWQTYINCDAITEAENVGFMGTIRFENIQSPEVPDITKHLGTLSDAAKQIVDAGNQLRVDCQDHADALNELRGKLKDLLQSLDATLAVSIVVGVFATLLTAGISDEAAVAAGAAEVAETAVDMKNVITTGRLAVLLRKVWSGAEDLGKLGKIRNLLSSILDLRATSAAEDVGALYSRAGALTNSQVVEQNVGLPRTMEIVEKYAKLAGVDLSRANLEIIDDPDTTAYLDYQGAIARTDAQGIQLGPAAFQDEETLVRTLAHENVHVQQYLGGQVTSMTGPLEDEAYASEDQYVETWRRNTSK